MAADETRKRRKRFQTEMEVEDFDESDAYYQQLNQLFFPKNAQNATLPPTIHTVEATRIKDSRGYDTVEVSVTLYNGIWAAASLPTDIPPGIYQSVEHAGAYMKFVNNDVNYVNNVIGPALIDKDPTQQADIDNLMIEMQERDGTAKERALRRHKLGLNAIMAVSVAICKAGAYVKNVPLARHVADLAGTGSLVLPIPSFKLLYGGSHYSDTNLAFQGLMITPVEARSFSDAVIKIKMLACDFGVKFVDEYDLDSFVVDESGGIMNLLEDFNPNIQDIKEALKLLKDLVCSDSKFTGKVGIGMDVAASEFYESDNMMYDLKFKYENNDGSGMISGTALKDFYKTLVNEYPITSISDPFHQDDWDNYSKLTSEIGKQVKVVMEADHLLRVGDSERIKKAIKEKTCNALLLKVNQRASVTDCIETVKICRDVGWAVVMASDCSGTTRDTFVADLSVGLAVDEMRMGNAFMELSHQFTKIEGCSIKDEVVFAGARQCDYVDKM